MIDKLAARFVAVADEDLSAAYDMGVQDSMLRAAQLERILRDLIDTLRAEGAGSPFDPWIRRSALSVMADEAGVRLAGVSPEFPSAVTVACADCERSFEVWVGEERAFYRFHRCGTDRRG